MTRLRNLGPVLVLTGAGVAVAAIVAGFIVVGGPGNARDRRLDDLTLQKIGQVVGVVQCAFSASGIAPVDYASAAKTRSLPPAPNVPPALCDGGGGVAPAVGQGDAPAAPGDITYQDVTPTQVKVCAKFHAPSRAESAQMFLPYSDIYPALAEGHPAGAHCYVLDLVKPDLGGGWPGAKPTEGIP